MTRFQVCIVSDNDAWPDSPYRASCLRWSVPETIIPAEKCSIEPSGESSILLTVEEVEVDLAAEPRVRVYLAEAEVAQDRHDVVVAELRALGWTLVEDAASPATATPVAEPPPGPYTLRRHLRQPGNVQDVYDVIDGAGLVIAEAHGWVIDARSGDAAHRDPLPAARLMAASRALYDALKAALGGEIPPAVRRQALAALAVVDGPGEPPTWTPPA